MSGQDQEPYSLSYMSDKTTGTKFLIDTGTQVSVLYATCHNHTLRLLNLARCERHTHSCLQAAVCDSELGLPSCFLMMVSDVCTSVIGAYFLTQHALLADVKRRRLLDSTIHLSVYGLAA